jgi:radical SAM superfamily enzyme YgiQ (UPF0313 family)
MNKKGKRILLIYPKSNVDYDLKISHKKPFISKQILSLINYFSKVKVFESTTGYLVPPLGIINIASITPADWHVEICDERIDLIDNIQLGKHCENFDIIGITTFTANIDRAYYLADNFKKQGIIVVLGGYHASLMKEEALEHCDSIISGFGELSWTKFLNDFESGSIKRIYENSKMVYVEPNWDFLKKEYYLSTSFVEVSRGCHNMCNFCCINSFHKKLSYRNVDQIITSLTKFNNHLVVLVSDNLTSNKEFCFTLFSKIISSKLNISIVANLSHEFAYDEDLVELSAKAGLKSALIGFETLNISNKEELHKNKKYKADYKKCIDTLHKYKIGITGCFIVGFEGDNENTVLDIYNFASENNLECLRISPLIPYPGTPIFNKLSSENRISHNNWSEYHTYGEHSIFQDPSDFYRIRNQIFITLEKYYSLSNIFIRIITSMNFKSYYLPYSISQWYKHNISLKQKHTKANKV